MIRNVVFDMGGVLLNYDPMMACRRHAGNTQDAQRVADAYFGTPEWIKVDHGTITEEEMLARAQKQLNDPRLAQIAEGVFHDWHLDSLWPKEGMAEIIEWISQKGYKLFILSNAGLRFRDFEYKIPHLDLFSGILVSAEEVMLKPNAEIYNRLCEKFDIKAEECLFIDDLQRNIDGAKNVNMQGYCFADGDPIKLKAYLETL
ncbi:MAG: HAD family phosphatase [Clostridiales bacterium]|nr:HAD family phosphatase [Clostridiales bacterium]